MSTIERLLVPGSTELPQCHCGDEMRLASLDPVTDEDWGGIEDAYGRSISLEVRAEFVVVTNGFVRGASAENTGSMEDALTRARLLHNRTQDLIAAIDQQPPNEVTRE